MLIHLCPRCGDNSVNPCDPPQRGVPLIATFWTSLLLGAILIGVGAPGAAAAVAIGLNAFGLFATIDHILQLWYQCYHCGITWYVYPWQRAK